MTSTAILTETCVARAKLAHSFRGKEFGTAQQLHGVTLIVEATATVSVRESLMHVVSALDLTNLNNNPVFNNKNTTMEVVARYIWECIDTNGPKESSHLEICVHESDIARCSYNGTHYTVWVRERAMIAHSFKGKLYGLAEGVMHGATLVVDAQFSGPTLDSPDYLIDVLSAEEILENCLSQLHNKNLDNIDVFSKVTNSTMEIVAKIVWEKLNEYLTDWPLITSLCVRVRESDVSWGQYSCKLNSSEAGTFSVKVRDYLGAFSVDVVLSGTTLVPVADILVDTHVIKECLRRSLESESHTKPIQVVCLSVLGSMSRLALDLLMKHIEVTVRYPNRHKVTAKCRTGTRLDETFQFDMRKYILAKNAIDFQSINPELASIVLSDASRVCSNKSEFRILDIGCGLLFMLHFLLDNISCLGESGTLCRIVYTALDLNADLMRHASSILKEKMLFSDTFLRTVSGVVVEVQLRCESIFDLGRPLMPYDLVFGACFIDLFSPSTLINTLTLIAPGALFYAPISFNGKTSFVPPLLDDELVSETYHKSMMRIGRFIDPGDFLNEIEDVGGTIIATAPSKWLVQSNRSSYFYDSLMHFIIENSIQSLTELMDTVTWLRYRSEHQCSIHIENLDIYCKIPDNFRFNHTHVSTYALFTAPKKIEVLSREILLQGYAENQILISSLYSLISSGTELKVFNGDFDNNCCMDDVFAQDEMLDYPLEYGYSICGRVVVSSDPLLVGKLVFAFHSHESHFWTDKSKLLVLPDGLSPKNGIFLSAVETALHIIHDSAPLVGETVAVFGQGMIGLLVTAILSRGNNHIVTIDPSPTRRAASSCMGSRSSYAPQDLTVTDFDICIEVSGNHHALQQAISATRVGGKVVIASWYGSTPVPLNLGLQFHRSQIHMVVSQVSHIPASLSVRWTKSRRFRAVWNIIQDINPVSLLRTHFVSLNEISYGFEQLANQSQLTVAIVYE